MPVDADAASLAALSPSDFENLTYDTLKSVGLKNLVWRTPGADGGRDIEGISYSLDITGHESVQRWYIECKRYQTSIDWPTVWKKIAYAEANSADVFLLSTNSNPSPDCETQISKWNSDRRRPTIRVWRGYEWKYLIATFPEVAFTYGVGEQKQPNDAVRPLTTALTKLIQASYMGHALGLDVSRSLEASAALGELITRRLDDLDKFSKFVDMPSPLAGEAYSWTDFSDDSIRDCMCDTVAFRAVISFARYLLNADGIALTVDADRIVGKFSGVKWLRVVPNSTDFQLIARWARLHSRLNFESGEFEVTRYE